MKRILVIEDEVKINKVISDYFTHKGFKIRCAFDGVEGLNIISKEEPFDLIILDVMLPELDGFSVLEIIRKNYDIPVIMVTAKGDQEDVLKGYRLKADDYIVKPFNIEILVAKVTALLDRIQAMRVGKSEAKEKILDIKGIKIDPQSFKAYIDEEEIQLEKKQFEMLQYFMENRKIVISRENLLNSLWGVDYFGNERVVDAQIKKLRKSLKHKAYLLKTVFGVGYKFDEE